MAKNFRVVLSRFRRWVRELLRLHCTTSYLGSYFSGPMIGSRRLFCFPGKQISDSLSSTAFLRVVRRVAPLVCRGVEGVASSTDAASSSEEDMRKLRQVAARMLPRESRVRQNEVALMWHDTFRQASSRLNGIDPSRRQDEDCGPNYAYKGPASGGGSSTGGGGFEPPRVPAGGTPNGNLAGFAGEGSRNRPPTVGGTPVTSRNSRRRGKRGGRGGQRGQELHEQPQVAQHGTNGEDHHHTEVGNSSASQNLLQRDRPEVRGGSAVVTPGRGINAVPAVAGEGEGRGNEVEGTAPQNPALFNDLLQAGNGERWAQQMHDGILRAIQLRRDAEQAEQAAQMRQLRKSTRLGGG